MKTNHTNNVIREFSFDDVVVKLKKKYPNHSFEFKMDIDNQTEYPRTHLFIDGESTKTIFNSGMIKELRNNHLGFAVDHIEKILINEIFEVAEKRLG